MVKAKARLNGAPADIAMVEPLRPSGPPPSRDITMTLDNQAREAIAPGSGVLVDGPVKLSLQSQARAPRVQAERRPHRCNA